MEYIERPKEVSKAEAFVQNREYIQKNMQGQLNNIYNYLDVIKESFDIKTGSSNIVINTSSVETNRYAQIGSLCLAQIVCITSNSIARNSKTLIAQGLPKPLAGIQFFAGSYDGSQYRVYIDTNGDLYAYYTSEIPQTTLIITVLYITS